VGPIGPTPGVAMTPASGIPIRHRVPPIGFPLEKCVAIVKHEPQLVDCNGGIGSERMWYGAAMRPERQAALRSKGGPPCKQRQRSDRDVEQARHY